MNFVSCIILILSILSNISYSFNTKINYGKKINIKNEDIKNLKKM